MGVMVHMLSCASHFAMYKTMEAHWHFART